MNEKFKELYSYIRRQNATDLTIDEFFSAYGNDKNKAKDVYDFVKSQQMTDLNEDDFFNAYFGNAETPQPTVKKKEEGMASPSEDGSLASSETENVEGTVLSDNTLDKKVDWDYISQVEPLLQSDRKREEKEVDQPIDYVDTPGAANIMPPEPSGPSAEEEEVDAMLPWEKTQYDLNQSRSRVEKTYVPTYEEGGELSPKYYGKRGEVSPEYLQDEYIDVPGADNIMRPEGVTLKEEGEVIQRKGEEKREADKKTLEKIQQKENLILSEEFQNDIASITEDVIDYNSSDAIDLLTEKYGKYGFVFRNVGLGSAIIPKSFTLNAIEVISTDNGATEVIELKPLAAGTTKKIKTRDETAKLKSFITNNAIPAGVVPEVTDDITNAVRLQTMRKNYTQLDDLSVGTLELTYREMPNGNFIVYPTLFPKNAATDYSTDPSEWMLLDADEAYLEAVLRGEVVSVDSEEKAKDLVNGSWRDISAVDVEADRFYKKRGLDYNAYMDMYNKYEDIMDKIVAIENSPMYEFQQDYSEEGGFEEQQAMKEKMAFLYIDGKKRADANNVLRELKDEAAILRESVNQDEFQRVREDFDKYLQDMYATNAAIAIDERTEADLYIEALNELSVNMLGLTAEEVASYEPKTEQEAEFVDKFNTEYDIIKIKKQEAADKYDIAHTWFNKKSDKAVMDEWVENLEAVSNSYKRGLANGNIGYIILAISLGLKDIDENSTVKEAAEAISKYAAEAQTGKEGRGFYRYQKGRTFAEEWDAFYDQPLEVGISLAAESLTQMLPYGSIIIPASAAIGAGMGAAYGGAATGGLAAGPAAFVGGGRGAQIGFATTIVALEYTNAVMDAARKKGYNVLIPEQMEIALDDDEVWEEGMQIGLKRGLTIGAISLLQTSLAGRIFRVKPLSSRAVKLGALTAEQALVNPLFEGGGEFLAQKVAGQKTNRKEIISEVIGGLFMPFANPISYSAGAINMYSDIRGKNNLSLAQRLSNVSEFNNVGETDSRISKWANEMHRLGKITSEQNQEIQKNVGRRREAKSLLDVSGNKNASTEVETRVMQLLAAKEKLSSTTNSRELFSEKIKNINDEIAETVSTGEVASKEAQVNLEGLVDISGRSVLDDASPYYAINGKKLSKKQFVSKMQKLTPEQTLKTNFIISNDADTQGIAEKKIIEALKAEGKTTADVGVDTDVTESFAEGLGETTSLDDIMEGGVEVDMDGAKVILTEDETGVTLESIETEEGKKGQGKAEAAINKITQKADSDGKKVTLKVVPKDNTVDANRLQALYERNGFEMQEDGVTMVRTPKAQEAATQTEADVIPTPIARPNKADVKAFDNNTIEESRLDGILSAIADKNIAGKKLTKFQERVAEKHKTRVSELEILKQDVASLEVDLEERLGSDEVQFQLSEGKTEDNVIDEKTKEAKKLFSELDKQESSGETVVVGEPTVEPTPITVGENLSLVEKIKRFKIKDLVNKKINLLMADKLKVELKDPTKPHNPDTNPYVKMGGNFFPLMERLFGKVAWASITDVAATKIIKGAMDADYSVVYNMGNGGIMSNIVIAEMLNEKIPDNQKTKIFNLIKNRVKESELKDVKKAKKHLDGATDIMSFFKALQENENVDTRAAVMELILPETLDVKTDIKLSQELITLGIARDVLIDETSEEFTKDLQTGALTMVVEITNKDGVKVSELKRQLDERLKKKEITQKEYNKGINEIIASAKISKEEAQAEGMQIHPNYPFYIRGRAVALMEETAPFYRLTDYYSNQLQERAVGLEKKRSGKVKYNANQAETEVFEKIQEAKSDKVNKANKLKAIEEILASDAFAKLKARDRKKMKPLLEKALQSNSNDAIKNLLKEAELPLAKMVNYSKAEAISAASTSAMTTSTTAYQISELNPTPWEIFLERLTKAFPTVEVITSQQEFDELTKNLWAKKLLTKNQTVYGAVYEGKLYLNGRVENFNTPIHEFGHIWINTAKQASPELYNKGMELISQDNTYINQIKNSSDYNRIIGEMRKAGATEEEIDTYIKEEALATAIGDKGESFVNASVSRDFKQWLVDLYKNIQKLFGISEYTAEQLENITLDEFVQAVTVDLLSGKELFKGQDVSALSSTLQLMTGDNVSAESIVSLGRELGYPNDAIKAILQNRGFDASTIKNALEIEVDLFNKMPYEFGNINEGAREGLKLFNDVKDKLQRFARQGKSAIEIRQKAQDILKAHPLFKNQIERIQLELQNAIDRDLKINRGPKISKEIKGIRKRIADIKKGQRNIKAAQTQLKNTIRTALVGIKDVSKSSVNKINNLITQATPENVAGITNLILAEIDTMVDAQQAESLRQSVLEFKRKVRAEEKVRRDVRNFQQEIRRVIRKSFAEMTKDTPAKVREFRVATINRLNKILNETNDQNYTEQLTKVLDELDNSREQVKKKLINEIKDTVKVKVKKTRSGKLTASGVDVRGKSYLDAVSRVLKLAMNGDVDGIINLMNSIDEDEYNTALDKDERGQKLSKKELDILNLRDAIDSYADIVNMELEQVKLLLDDLKNTRAESIKNFNTRRKMRRQLSESIKEQFKTQISKDFSELYDEKGQRKSDSQLKKDRKPIMQAFIKDGFLETLKDFKARVTENIKYKTGALAMFMKENMFNLDLITQRLDRNTNGLFTEFFYNSLLDMENNALRGYFIEEKVLDGITNNFTNKEWNKWKYSLGNDVITLDGIISVQEDTSKEPYSVELNRDQAMALYALTLNDTQREKLNNQGLDDAKILQLKEFIGEDNIAIIESTVDYLSNPYFESVNNVFMQANDISLRQIENYFPTQTDVSATNSEDLFNGDFFKVFNAEWQSALKERTAKIGDVVMNRSFTQTLEKHFRDMERFKAYALGVKTMNQVYKSPDVQTLLDMSGYKNIFQQMLSQGINPNAVPKMKRGDKLLSWAQNTFSAIVLAFKPIQALKQTTSFMLPLGDYQFRKGKHTPVVDLFTFLYDYADVRANRKKNVAEAKEMSGLFEERYRRGMKGDLLAIESGQRTYRPALEAQGIKGAVARAVSRAKAFFTSHGDINGVLGYKARFNRDIKNGMSKAEALRRFNQFDSTQQAQTNVNKIGLQQTNNPLVKAVTMFGSQSFLLLNNTMKYAGRIINGTATYSDYVNFIQNAVVANMLYTTASYSMALLFGDKDDREYALKQILYSGNPLTLLYRLPLVGAAIESGIAAYRGEYFSRDSMKNPYSIYAKKLTKAAKESDAYEGTKLLLEVGTASPMDPAEGIFNIATGEGEMDDMFKIMGVAKSYRPGYATKEKPKGKPKKKKSSGLNLTKEEREELGLSELPKMPDDLPKMPTLKD